MMNPPRDRALGPIAAAAGLAIALLLAWAPSLSAYDGATGNRYNGPIRLNFDGVNFSVGSRCYDNAGKGLHKWLKNTRTCTENSYGRKPRYIKIQKKNFWGQDRGSAWRKWRDCEGGTTIFCVQVNGTSVGNATASTPGCEVNYSDCPGD